MYHFPTSPCHPSEWWTSCSRKMRSLAVDARVGGPKDEAESRSAGIICLYFPAREMHPLLVRIEDDPMGKGEL
uniref:Uncharacterized protein n=1 Tax=Globodera pallida TaxID=36090 RepID=A0A183C5T5_GLOPA